MYNSKGTQDGHQSLIILDLLLSLSIDPQGLPFLPCQSCLQNIGHKLLTPEILNGHNIPLNPDFLLDAQDLFRQVPLLVLQIDPDVGQAFITDFQGLSTR